MPSIYDIGLAFRADLLARERSAAVRVLQTYAQAWADIEKATRELLDAIGGERPTQGQLAQLSQYAALLDTLERAVTQAAGTTSGVISREQIAALQTGAANARDMILALMPADWVPFVQPAPLDAVNAMAGYTQDGTPLDVLLQQSGSGVAQAIKDELTRAIVAGLSPAETARRLKALWGQSATRALTTARTELLRSYRESSRAQYQANSDVVKGWQWLCARSKRTCPACLALDGKVFDLDEPQPAHVNCRCTMIPVMRNREAPRRQTGAEWLANQDPATQQAILGDRGYEAYSSGAALDDFVSYRHSRDWGKQALWKVPEQQ